MDYLRLGAKQETSIYKQYFQTLKI